MRKVIPTLLSLLCLGAMSSVAHAAPQPCGTRVPNVPTKLLRISNNSDTMLYAFLQSPERSAAGLQDLWMQAVCGVTDWTLSGGKWVTNRAFHTTRNYRAYITTNAATSGEFRRGGLKSRSPITLS